MRFLSGQPAPCSTRMCLRQKYHWPSPEPLLTMITLRSDPAPRAGSKLSLMTTTYLTPGRISPQRKVPPNIVRPEYVGKKAPKVGEPDVKTPEIIEAMRVAGRIAGQALAEVGRAVRPGVSTDELDRIGHEFLLDH